VAFLSRRELRERYGIRRPAALLGFDNLVSDPRKLAAGYLRAAQTRAARIFAPVEVVDVDESPRQIVATVRSGHEIRAQYVVYATGYELAQCIPSKGHRIASTWAIATKPQRSHLWPTECLIWEASESYLYLRTTPDGRIICGGEDEPFQDETLRDALSPRKVRALERKLKALLPGVDATAAFHWTGSFGASDTGTPSIGLVPGRRRTLAVLGYGGNGITFSMLAAQIVRGIVTGTGDPDAKLFALAR
jgi:glycine/D-amino acid oxidase-like deaminating enzyme